ncbi:uncharacterized protein [Rutidosis leptorrhynchoides]|uniref:uncharacterized protein n=1 Tax=Rutidosis leptorrhynchoides TaxID=125765 RepID=UPI003A9A00BC
MAMTLSQAFVMAKMVEDDVRAAKNRIVGYEMPQQDQDDFPSLFFICEQKTSCVKKFRFPLEIGSYQLGWNLHLKLPLSDSDRFKAHQLNVILSRYKLSDLVADQLSWTAGSSDSFLVADAIRLMVQSSSPVPHAWPKVVWGNCIPSKIMVFHWLAIKNSIPVKDVLARRHILPSHVSNLCVFCSLVDEFFDHLLLHCNWSFRIWSDLFHWWNIRWVIPRTVVDFFFDWYYGMCIKASRFWKMIGPATIWAIWTSRNDLVFNGTIPNRLNVVRNIKLVHGLQFYVWEQNPFLLCM